MLDQMNSWLGADAWDGVVGMVMVITLFSIAWQQRTARVQSNTLQSQLLEMQRQGFEDRRPLVVVDWVKSSLVRLRIRNLGKTPALDIRFEWQGDHQMRVGACKDPNHNQFPHTLSHLVPGSDYTIPWGESDDLFRQGAAFEVVVRYKSIDGSEWKDTYKVNLGEVPHVLLDEIHHG